MANGLGMERADGYRGKVTSRIVIASIIASTFGFIVGYSGILGQVTNDRSIYDSFLLEVSDQNPRDYNYCKYRNRFDIPISGGAQYLAAALGSIISYPLVKKYGRRKSILIAGVISLIGSAVGVYPMHVVLLYSSWIVLGFGIGFGSQVALLYISEISPARFRGGLSTIFQLEITLGMLLGNMVIRELGQEPIHMWVVFFWYGFPLTPSLVIILGGIKFIPETPNGLVEQGLEEKGREMLAIIRGTEDVDVEFQDIVDANEFAKPTRKNHFLAMKNIFQKRNRPHLVIAILMPLFQNLTGIGFVFVFAPLMFWSLGSNYNSSTYSVAINGAILVLSTITSMIIVDRIGRRVLLISGGVLMGIIQVIIAIMLGSNLFNEQLNKDDLSILVTILIGIFVFAYGISWGPLGWTIPSEIFTLETRLVGQSIAVSLNFLFAYLVLQFYVPLLCALNSGLFVIFACMIVVMTVFVCMFVPETKGVPIEQMSFLWSKHWFWKRFAGREQDSSQLVPPESLTPSKDV